RALNVAWVAVKSTFMAVGAALLPTRDQIQRMTAFVIDNASAIRSWAANNRELIQTVGLVAVGVAGIGLSMLALGPIMATIAPAAQIIASGLAAGLAVIPGVVGIAGTAIATLGTIITGTFSVAAGAIGSTIAAAAGLVGIATSLAYLWPLAAGAVVGG